jgi:hypothetical protein
MFREPGRFRERILSIAQKFREKGATSADRAMTSQELALPPRFDEAMKRRLGHTGIFVDVGGGKYYLNEARLKEFQSRPQGMGTQQPMMYHRRRTSMIALRIARLVLAVIIFALVLFNFFYERSLFLWFTILALIILWFVITIFQIVFRAGVRRRRMMRQPPDYSENNFPPSQ